MTEKRSKNIIHIARALMSLQYFFFFLLNAVQHIQMKSVNSKHLKKTNT